MSPSSRFPCAIRYRRRSASTPNRTLRRGYRSLSIANHTNRYFRGTHKKLGKLVLPTEPPTCKTCIKVRVFMGNCREKMRSGGWFVLIHGVGCRKDGVKKSGRHFDVRSCYLFQLSSGFANRKLTATLFDDLFTHSPHQGQLIH
jgi:hypothetical protein